jgi:dinuclear metal center YbgI/SA1388 family protein
MPSLETVTAELERIAPLRLAADWDAVGLLVAPRQTTIQRVLACLTLTPAVAAVAVQEGIDLVVTHHPLPFRPIARITPVSGPGRVLLDLIGSGCGVWSSHTAWDSARGGINDQLADLLGLEGGVPIEPDAVDPLSGFGRVGTAGGTLGDLARRAAGRLEATAPQLVGDPARPAGRVGVVCGSGGDLVPQVVAAGCDTLVTGEIKLHQAFEADAAGLAVIALGHHASERFSMDVLATRLAAGVPGLSCRTTPADRDPLAPLA